MKYSFLKSAVAAATVSVTAVAMGALAAAAAEDAVIAKINGEEIRESDLALAEAELGPGLHQMPPSRRRRVMVEYLIDTRLFADEADAEKLTTGPAFEQRAKYWEKRAKRDEFYEKKITGAVSDGLARGIYEDRVKMIERQDEVEASHILVDSEEKAKELAERAKKGDDFAKLAMEHSKDKGSKENGGKLGYFVRGRMVKEFEDAAFGLPKGDVSAPVKSQFGWHIIKVTDKRTKPLPKYEEVRDQIIGSLAQQNAERIIKALRDKANIEYVDSEVRMQVEQDNIRAAAMKKLRDKEMSKQLQMMEADKNKKK